MSNITLPSQGLCSSMSLANEVVILHGIEDAMFLNYSLATLSCPSIVHIEAI